MEEFSKNRVILILVISNLIFLISTIKTSIQVGDSKKKLDSEMVRRFDLEESKMKLEAKIKSLSDSLQEEQVAHQATKKALLDEQNAKVALKDELDKITKLKETLEEDLKEALVKIKSSKDKK